MQEVEPTGHRGCTGSGRYSNEAVANAALESFARWQDCQFDRAHSCSISTICACKYAISGGISFRRHSSDSMCIYKATVIC